MPNAQIVSEFGVSAIQSLEGYFLAGGTSLIRAAFAHTFFVAPDRVREQTPYYPARARVSREHYPGLDKGKSAIWDGDGRPVVLDDNQYAQSAWERYTGTGIARGSGYGLRHIWGHPWNPDAFTAGWNFCYMPFWAGMLTERQHRLTELEQAIRQASWDLYFRDNPVCEPPDLVKDPGLDLVSILDGQSLRIMRGETSYRASRNRAATPAVSRTEGSVFDQVRTIRRNANQSWVNIRKASRLLQGKTHEPFGTKNVESSAKSIVGKIQRETNLSFAEIEALLDEHGLG